MWYLRGDRYYRDPALQRLDDAEVLYAIVGALVILRILPYRESVYRHLVYN